MTTPRRREVRRAHLDAATVPVERALLARAEALEQETRDELGVPQWLTFTAAEFRKLAEELHWVA